MINIQLKIKAVMVFCICFWNPAFAQDKTDYSTQVNISKNIRYGEIPEITKEGTSSDRLLDIYLPKEKQKEKLPVLVYIHGGGFVDGSKDQRTDFCSRLAAGGIAVIAINYRLYLKYNKIPGASCGANMSKGLPVSGTFHTGLQQAIKTAAEDASLALVWIKKNAKKYNLDMNKVTLSGGSAGAITALYTSLCTKTPLKIKSVVNMWGGVENNKQILNPSIPVLTFHGDKDALISVDYAYSLHQFLEENNNKSSKLIILKGVGHGGPAQKQVLSQYMETILSFVKNDK